MQTVSHLAERQRLGKVSLDIGPGTLNQHTGVIACRGVSRLRCRLLFVNWLGAPFGGKTAEYFVQLYVLERLSR